MTFIHKIRRIPVHLAITKDNFAAHDARLPLAIGRIAALV
jgi:hypothetical protein